MVSLPDHPILECEFALVLADNVRLIVAPLGAAALGSRVASIETGPGFECRDRNRVAAGKISAHGKGLAVDLVAVALADKLALDAIGAIRPIAAVTRFPSLNDRPSVSGTA